MRLRRKQDTGFRVERWQRRQLAERERSHGYGVGKAKGRTQGQREGYDKCMHERTLCLVQPGRAELLHALRVLWRGYVVAPDEDWDQMSAPVSKPARKFVGKVLGKYAGVDR